MFFALIGEKTEGWQAAKLTTSSCCATCGKSYSVVGPIWLDSLVDVPTVNRMYAKLMDAKQCQSLKMRERAQALLRVVLEEVHDVPLFLNITSMVHVSVLSLSFHSHMHDLTFLHSTTYRCWFDFRCTESLLSLPNPLTATIYLC